MSTNPQPPNPGATRLLDAAKELRDELDVIVQRMLAGGPSPSKAEMVRLRELRKEARAIEAAAGAVLREQECLWQAIGERLGRPARDGDDITPADKARAAEILEE